jgi:hypothetical protein
MAMEEPALMSTAMAVAASHYSRWQHTTDTTSRKYLRSAAKALSNRFLTPELVNDQITLASMLLLVSYEVLTFPPFAGMVADPARCFPAHVDGKAITMQSVGG